MASQSRRHFAFPATPPIVNRALWQRRIREQGRLLDQSTRDKTETVISTSPRLPMPSPFRAQVSEAASAPGSSIFGVVAAAILSLVLLLPFALRGNPYPAPVILYWIVGTVAVAGV